MILQRLQRQISLAREIAIIAAMSAALALVMFAALVLKLVIA